jgi:hypothetical protein
MIYRAGGTGAVSAGIEAQLVKLYGRTRVVRLAGATRFGTAQMVSKRAVSVMAAKGIKYSGKVFVVSGMDYRDAELISPIAYKEHIPILTLGPVDLPFRQAAATMKATDAIVIGATKNVSVANYNAVAAYFGALRTTRPCAQTDQYSQSVAVAEWATTAWTFDWEGVGLATGEDYPDALTAGPALGTAGAPLLFTPRLKPDSRITAVLAAHKYLIYSVRYFGGTGAVSPAVRDSVAATLK